MTYLSPRLSLIGNAAGVVLAKTIPPEGTFDSLRPSGIAYDATALLETEW